MLRQCLNVEITGNGIETTMHMPCFYCGAKDFMVYRIVDSETAMNTGELCKECGRGMRMPVEPDPAGGKSIRFLQTTGAEPEPWHEIKIPRVQSN